jgi:intraflagellar transport protein 46
MKNAKPAALGEKVGGAGESGEMEDRPLVGAYDPADYAGLQVSQDIKDLFNYITSFQPQKIDLDTKFKPFMPDYIPTVGEVDAQLKMTRPDTSEEFLGIDILDEPCLNPEDATVLEMRYINENMVNTGQSEVTVQSIEAADKNPKEVTRWISSVSDLHESRPLPTVQYSKNMPDFDKLMEEWPPETEQVL